MDGWLNCLVESMICYIGQTVTIFTTSGGLSGSPICNRVYSFI